MNKLVNKLLLAEDKLMPQLHLRQSIFTFSACANLLNLVKGFKNLKKQAIRTN